MIGGLKKFPNYRQLEAKDCGPTCLKIILKHYGVHVPLTQITKACETTREGTNLAYLSIAAKAFGFQTLMASVSFEELRSLDEPYIVHWEGNHFIVVYKIGSESVEVSDPARGLISYSISDFIDRWNGTSSETAKGVALLLEPSEKFDQKRVGFDEKETSFGYLLSAIFNHKKELWVILISILFSLVIQFTLPFLFQIIVDQGIGKKDLNLIYLIIIFQVFLLIGKLGFEIHRRWCLLQISTRVGLSLLAEFFRKLVRLPISFFDVKLTGDLMQRIIDHKRVEEFINTSSVSIILSVASFLIFSSVLGFYSLSVLAIFLIGASIYLIWVFVFLNKRVRLDNEQFILQSKVTTSTMEFINGMQEIRLNNAGLRRISKLELIYLDILRLTKESLKIENLQFSVGEFINEVKNILIIVFVCVQVTNDTMSLGMLLSISFVIGQLNGPLAQFVQIVKSWQDSDLSIKRINEIHRKEETPLGNEVVTESQSIAFENVSYRYYGKVTNSLTDISFRLDKNLVTAIVGSSGSGKTTLLKILLKYYEPSYGNVKIGDISFGNLNSEEWWNQCGIVMQEGLIFNGTIAENISMTEPLGHDERMDFAARIACIDSFISSLPTGFNTVIGQEGMGLSTGQKQRILIARAVYKNPRYLFFDEATSSLDANNEKQIMENLQEFFQCRTVFIIAHRLSTVMNANRIIVLDEGRIVEYGDHQELVSRKGHYFNLIKNQLELNSLNEI